MKIRMNRKQSIVFTAVYGGITLFWRFMIEPQLMGHYAISIGIGLFFVLVYYLLWKNKIVNFDHENHSEKGSGAETNT